MRIDPDTSVLIAASRSRIGASFRIASMLPSPELEIALTIAVYTEWQAALTRTEHPPPGATPDMALGFFRYLASSIAICRM